VSRELRIGVTGMSTAGEMDDPYAGVNLAAALNPNFVDGMNHWEWNHYYDYYPEVSAVNTLPMEFTPDPTITTGCRVNPYGNGGGVSYITQDKVAIPEDLRATLPCDFTISHWRLQVGGSEGSYVYFRPVISMYNAAGYLLDTGVSGLALRTDIHAWQQASYTQTIPATVHYLALGISFQDAATAVHGMYYTATKLECVSPGPPARNLEAFSVSRDSAGILIAVRDNAAPQFAVSRDADGLALGAWR